MNILLLGGTTEARKLAGALAERPGIETTLSLAGVTRNPLAMPVPVRVGGFGGVAGLAEHVREHGVDLIVDATHPYAGRMSRHAVAVCRETACRLWRLERPVWQPRADDDWHLASDLDDAAQQLAGFGANVFLSVGARSLAPFATVAGKHWIVRSIQMPEPPPGFVDWTPIQAQPPFALTGEIELFRQYAVDVLVTKNSGAVATTAKLDAARELGLPVLMVRRPVLPEAEQHFTSVAAVADALNDGLATRSFHG